MSGLPVSLEALLEGIWTEEDFELDRFIVWNLGSEIVINRNLMPKKLEILQDFKTYNFNFSYKKGDEIYIGYEKVGFFYNQVNYFIERSFGDRPFDMRFIKAGIVYIDLKLDRDYSLLYQQTTGVEGEDPELENVVGWKKIFKSANIGDDMEL